MKKTVKYFLFSALLIVLVSITTLFFLGFFNHEKIRKRLVETIDKQFVQTISFKDFSLSYLTDFPRAKLSLQGISVTENNLKLLQIRNVDVHLNLRHLLNKKVTIELIKISGVTLQSNIDSLGNKTRLLTLKNKKAESDTTHTSFVIESKILKLTDSHFILENRVKGNITALYINSADITWSKADSLLFINANVEGKIDSLVANNKLLFSDQPIKINKAKYCINQKSKETELLEGEAFVRNFRIYPYLKTKPERNGMLIDLQVNTEGDFNALLELVELNTKVKFVQENKDAKLAITYHQKGFVNPFHRPLSTLNFELSNARISADTLPYPVTVSILKGNFVSGEIDSVRTSSVSIDTIHAEALNSYVDGKFFVTNFENPDIDSHLNISVDLSNILKETRDLKVAGNAKLDLAYKGKVKDLMKAHYSGYLGSFEVNKLKADFKKKKFKVEVESGYAKLDNHYLEIKNFKGLLNGSPFLFHGNMRNPLLHLAEPDKDLTGSLNFDFNTIDISGFIPEKKSAKKATFFTKSIYNLSKHVAINLSITGKKLITPNVTVQKLNLSLKQDNQQISMPNLSFTTSFGDMKGKGDLAFNEKGITLLNAGLNGHFTSLEAFKEGVVFKRDVPEIKNEIKGNKKVPPKNQVAGVKSESAHSKADSVSRKQFTIPDYVNLNVMLKVDKGKLSKFDFKNLMVDAGIQNSIVNIRKFSASIPEGEIKASGQVNFDPSGITGVNMQTAVNLNELKIEKYFDNQKNPGKDAKANNKLSVPGNASLKVDVTARKILWKDLAVDNFNTSLRVNNNQIRIDKFSAGTPIGKVDAQMVVDNFTGEKRKYSGKISLAADTISVNDLMTKDFIKSFSKPKEEAKMKPLKPKSIGSFFPENFDLTMNFKAKKLKYNNAVFRNLDLQAGINKKRAELKKLSFDFASGKVNVDGYVTNEVKGPLTGYLKSDLQNLRMEQILKSFDNFGQTVFTPENSTGNVTWKSNHYFSVNQDMKIADDNIWVFDLQLHDAEFIEVEPIKNVIKVIGHKAKNDLRIKDFEAQAYFFNNKLIFSDVMLNDNIVKMQIFGDYSLKNSNIDIGTKVSLSDLFRKSENRIVDSIDSRLALEKDAKIFLRLSGFLNDHKVNLNSKRKIESFEREIKSEVKTASTEFNKKEKKRKTAGS